jgi:heavy metal sensor kinase
MRWPRSLRSRLTLWYTIVLGLPLVAFATASFYVLDRALLHRADAFLDETLGAFTTELQSEQREESTTPDAIRASLHDVQFRDVRLAVFDSLGTLVAAGTVDSTAAYALRHPVDLARVGRELHDRATAERTVFTIAPGSRAYRVAAEPVRIFGRHYLVAAAYPLHRDRDTMERVGTSYVIAIPILLLIASLGGYFLASRSLSPVAAMSARAAEISAKNLNERLPVSNRRDELSALAQVVNNLLERLEQAFAQQRRFMADASHELRTPVAVLRTEADVTLSRPNRTESEYRDSVAVMRDSARRLGRIVDDLFLLARADAGHLPLKREPLYLEDVVDEAARAGQSLAAEKGVQVALLPLEDSPFTGDADLLGRVLLNLLDNAIKHSPRGGTVTLSLSHTPSEYHISVADVGPGIPLEAQSQVFERFFRVDKTRSRTDAEATAGAGLGLAIGRWIAEAHGGRLELVRSDSAGTEFRLALPKPRDSISAPLPFEPSDERAGVTTSSFTASDH